MLVHCRSQILESVLDRSRDSKDSPTEQVHRSFSGVFLGSERARSVSQFKLGKFGRFSDAFR